MEWQWILVIMVIGILAVMASGLPIAFGFLLLVLIGSVIFWGGEAGPRVFIINMRASISSFTLVPIVMFILMGEVMFQSGMGMRMLDTMNGWLGRLPGRLGLLAVGFATLFATMSGSSISSTALMGTVLKPEMEARGYKKPISIGAIMGAGGLASIIPPSGLAVLLGAVGAISIGRLLISGIVPGLMIAALYAIYIIGRCWLQPSVAPPYEVILPSLSAKIKATVKYVLPLGLIIFLVLGLIFLGFATPAEAAAMGAVGSLFLAACYRNLKWEMLKKTVMGTLRSSVMVYMIFTGAITFSQLLAFSGVTRGLTGFMVGLPLPPMMILAGIMLVVLMMGTFVSATAIIMVSIPIFMPVILTLGFDPVWFGLLFLINIEMALTTPPFGMLLFVMKGVSSPDTTMGDIYKAGYPFLVCDATIIILVMFLPVLALWLPGLAFG